MTFCTKKADPQQMTFEVLLNPSVKERDGLRLSRQARRIYALLQRGPVKTSELVAIACQYSARIFEIRKALAPLGLMIDEVTGEGGQNKYRIVELAQSTFWKKVEQKDEAWKWL